MPSARWSIPASRSETGTPPKRAAIRASALDAVAHVGDAVLALEDPRALQLDVLGAEALEEPAPLAEEDRDDVKLELVEDAGGERELRKKAVAAPFT